MNKLLILPVMAAALMVTAGCTHHPRPCDYDRPPAPAPAPGKPAPPAPGPAAHKPAPGVQKGAPVQARTEHVRPAPSRDPQRNAFRPDQRRRP